MFITTWIAIALSVSAQNSSPILDVRDSVKSGLNWLSNAQDKDGSWGGHSGLYRTSTTAFAGLALLMEGSTPKEGRYAPNIRKAITWYEANARPSGLLVPQNDTNDEARSTYAHACAMLFLVSAYDVDDDEPRRKRVAKLIDSAIGYAAADRSSRGVWTVTPRRQSGDNEDTFTTVQMLDALVAAERVGLRLPDRLIESATQYLVKATNAEGGIVYSLANGIQPRGGDGQAPPTAAAGAILATAGKRPEPLPKWVSFAARTQPAQIARMGQTESNTLLHLLDVARVANSLGESGHRRLDADVKDAAILRWSAFRARVFAELKRIQSAEGSWKDAFIGPAHTTGVALILLQLENNYLPAFSK